MSQAAKTSTLAIVALVCAIFCQPLGLILGIIALVQISNSQGAMKGQGLAIAAIVIGALMFVIGILAAIAIPNFIRYTQRSKQTEAKSVLMSIATSQEIFKVDRDVYASLSADGGGGGSQKGPWEGRACPQACETDVSACTEFSCVGYQAHGPMYFEYECSAAGAGDEAGFVCAAVGDLDDDGRASVWLVGRGGPAPLPSIATAAGCNSAPVGEGVFDCTRGTF